MAVTCGLDLGVVFLFAGLMNVASGLVFRQPIPVQPMKAIAALAIAEGLEPGTIAAAGIWMGGLVLAIAMSGLLERVVARIPLCIVRGIQAGVGLKLAVRAFEWGLDLPLLGADSAVLALVALAVLAFAGRKRAWPLPLVFLAGFVLARQVAPDAFAGARLQPSWPALAPIASADWATGFYRAALPQLPLTLLNSVVAVCALSSDYFPGRGVAPRRMAASVGLFNLIAAPFGGMPMCHGSGGLAAQHRFGARGGGAVLLLGAALVAVALAFGASLGGALRAYPKSILAPMVLLAGLALAAAARDQRRWTDRLVVLTVVAGTLLASTGIGFLAGCAAAFLTARLPLR